MANRRKFETNVQFLIRVMEHSQFGALKQAFVMDALDKMAEAVAKADPKEVGNGLVNGNTWVGCAKELQAELKKHFAS